MQNRKGFTLVEMLVVIAVIGIISTVALTALGPSRTKAKDTRIISDLNQVRAVAETLYTTNYAALPTGVAIANHPQIGPLNTSINNNGGSLQIAKFATDSKYRAFSQLPGGGFYCVNSDGFAGTIANQPTDVNDSGCQ